MHIIPYRCPRCGHETGDFGVGVPELLICADCNRPMCHGCRATRRLLARPKNQCRDCAAVEAEVKNHCAEHKSARSDKT